MQFICESCKAHLIVADEKIRGKRLIVRCKRCGVQIRIVDPALLPSQSGGRPPTGPIRTSPGAPSPAGGTSQSGGRPATGPVRTSQSGGRPSTGPVARAAAPRRDTDTESTRAMDSEVLEKALRASKGEGAAPPSPAPPAPRSAPPPPPRDPAVWFAMIQGNQAGPITRAELALKASAGQVGPRTYLWKDGMESWIRAKDVPEFVPLFAAPPAPPPPPRDEAAAQRPEARERRVELPFESADGHVTPPSAGHVTPPSAEPVPAPAAGVEVEESASPDAPTPPGGMRIPEEAGSAGAPGSGRAVQTSRADADASPQGGPAPGDGPRVPDRPARAACSPPRAAGGAGAGAGGRAPRLRAPLRTQGPGVRSGAAGHRAERHRADARSRGRRAQAGGEARGDRSRRPARRRAGAQPGRAEAQGRREQARPAGLRRRGGQAGPLAAGRQDPHLDHHRPFRRGDERPDRPEGGRPEPAGRVPQIGRPPDAVPALRGRAVRGRHPHRRHGRALIGALAAELRSGRAALSLLSLRLAEAAGLLPAGTCARIPGRAEAEEVARELRARTGGALPPWPLPREAFGKVARALLAGPAPEPEAAPPWAGGGGPARAGAPRARFSFSFCAAAEELFALHLGAHGRRSAGLYYTPAAVAAEVVALALRHGSSRSPSRVLDPCAGAGAFLCAAAAAVPAAALSGADLHADALRAARAALALLGARAELRRADSLRARLPPADLLVGNPPYGHVADAAERAFLLNRLPALRGGEIVRYAAFLLRSLSLLRPGGTAALLVPDTWMTNARSGPLREAVLDAADLAAVCDLGKPFAAAKDTRVQAVVLVRRTAGRRPPRAARVLRGRRP